jgi:hypothetical protein
MFRLSSLVRSLGLLFLSSLLFFLCLAAPSQAASTQEVLGAVEAIKVLLLNSESSSSGGITASSCTAKIIYT